jgi:hypothetical protein
MLAAIRSRLTFANVVSLLALFVRGRLRSGGEGKPVPGTASTTPNFSYVVSFPDVIIAPVQNPNPAVGRVMFRTPNLQTDTSFMIAAPC